MGYIDDYRAKMNLTANLTPKDLILDEMKRQFKEYLQATPTIRKIKVFGNEMEYSVDIQDVSQINKNNNDEKYCISEFNLQMQIGQIIVINEFEYKNWIITEKENMTIEDRQRYKIRPCNNVLTFKTSLNKTVTVPCIISNLTLYSDGLEVKTITSLDGKRNVIIPLNNDTKDLFVQQRFIFNHNSIFSISLIDDFSVNGLLQMTMIQDTFKDTDDKVNNLADNNILPITITFPQSSYTINQGNILQLQPQIKQGDKILNLSVYYTSESLDNQGFVNVSESGIVTGISVGTSKVTCSLVDNSGIKSEVDIRVLYPNPVQAISYLISGNEIIKKTSTNTYVASRKIDNVEDANANFEFFIDYNGLPVSAVTMTIVDSKTIKIKNNNVENASITLRAMDSISGTNTYKTIQLKGIYG